MSSVLQGTGRDRVAYRAEAAAYLAAAADIESPAGSCSHLHPAGCSTANERGSLLQITGSVTCKCKNTALAFSTCVRVGAASRGQPESLRWTLPMLSAVSQCCSSFIDGDGLCLGWEPKWGNRDRGCLPAIKHTCVPCSCPLDLSVVLLIIYLGVGISLSETFIGWKIEKKYFGVWSCQQGGFLKCSHCVCFYFDH